MTTSKSPSEIAREALSQLALKRVPPTPDNYRAFYAQIAGLPEKEDLRASWVALLPDLLREWKREQQGATESQKKAALDRAVGKGGSESALLQELSELTVHWARIGERSFSDKTGLSNSAVAPANSLGALKQIMAQLVETAATNIAGDRGSVTGEARTLAQRLSGCNNLDELAALTPELKRLIFRLELSAEDKSDLHSGVLHLLQIMVDNVSELVVDDDWLKGQIAVVRDILAAPSNLRAIDDTERRLKDVIIRQSSLKTSLVDARNAIKEMLSGFVLRLADFTEETSSYHDKIESCATRIHAADNIKELEEVVREVMQETRAIQLSAQRSRDELRQTRARVDAAERRIVDLQKELGQTSDLVRHDQLTGALNRRGLEDVFEKEIARAARHQTPLCLAVLDVDNFKQLNDTLGHVAGDAALVHLTNVIRETLRPQDALTRYGGEEFLIILPDTVLEDAREAIVRVQRELTRKFFMHENQKLLMTFSAGVTLIPAEEKRDAAIARADKLMYEAKKAGKNRVVAL